jgi:hypothetical protein
VILQQSGFGAETVKGFVRIRRMKTILYRKLTMPGRERVERVALVELAGDDRVLDEELEWNDLERVFVGGFEDDGAGGSNPLDLEPSGRADAPAVAGFEAGKTKLRHRSAEVVAESLGGFEKRSVDDAADRVDAVIVRAGLATAAAVEAGHGFAAADVKGLAEDVLAAVFDGFNFRHR